MRFREYRHIGVSALLAALLPGLWQCQSGSVETANTAGVVPSFTVDPYWPKPLPAPKDENGYAHQWITGEPSGTCIDSHDHIITVNRGWFRGGLVGYDGVRSGSIPSPPVVMYDTEGNVVGSWGDTTLSEDSVAVVMAQNFHGCHVDFEGNIWIASNGDGVVQKYSHDGQLLMQIGTKGLCDGPATTSPDDPYPTCGEPGYNTSTTLLNEPSDVHVDPDPDPVTGEPGSIYISDGYGNYRVVVFDRQGKYLRQWGEAGRGPGQFVETTSGHPHCVQIVQGLVYTCDRGPGDGIHQTRIQVFDKVGDLQQIIPIQAPGNMLRTSRTSDIAFSRDEQQTWMYVTDLGAQKILIVNRKSGEVVGSIGHPGRMAGELAAPHTLATDSKGNIYVSETITGRRNQKFVKVN